MNSFSFEYGAIKQLLFDEHFNYIDATCYSESLLQEFPAFYNPDAGGRFYHDCRYKYWEEMDPITGEIRERTDINDYGWWYHHEPDSRRHTP